MKKPFGATKDALKGIRRERRKVVLGTLACAIGLIYCLWRLVAGIWAGAIEPLGKGDHAQVLLSEEPARFLFWIAIHFLATALFAGLSYFCFRAHFSKVEDHRSDLTLSTNLPNK